MTKNPFMSAYLSAANRVANTARGHATNEFKRQSKRQTTSMVNAWVDAWTPKPKAKAKPARKTQQPVTAGISAELARTGHHQSGQCRPRQSDSQEVASSPQANSQPHHAFAAAGFAQQSLLR